MSDSKFEYIDDVLLNVDKDKIEKKKKSPIKPLALLILGAVILWYGANILTLLRVTRFLLLLLCSV